jgi:hypothetical protein
MTETLVQQCVNFLKREDIKNEIKKLLQPFIYFILNEINPYIYIIISILSVMFLMLLTIIILLINILRKK